MNIRRLVIEFLRDTQGQDIVEYALLTAFIGLVGAAAWFNVVNEVGLHYAGWGTGVNTLSSCTPDPGGGGCPGGS